MIGINAVPDLAHMVDVVTFKKITLGKSVSYSMSKYVLCFSILGNYPISAFVFLLCPNNTAFHAIFCPLPKLKVATILFGAFVSMKVSVNSPFRWCEIWVC